jgi:putative endonuclease
MAQHLVTGQQGEEIARKYLRRKRYKILGTNVRTWRGELDIIARKKRTLVFVEVKTRTSLDGFQPSDRVDWWKMWRLRRAAQAWIDEQQEKGMGDMAARIDIIGVCEGRVVEHYEDVTA